MPSKPLLVTSPLLLSLLTGGLLWWQPPSTAMDSAAPGAQGSPKPVAPATPPASYVGGERCRGCHATQYQLWRGSHHDLAMQPANDQTVLGDFHDAEFTYFDTTSRFYRDGERFMVRTDGPDGTLQDYAVTYTFGVDPLQQYLVEFPGGRLQALGIAWDTRQEGEGGQRWFHLYPEEHVDHTDELHWTRRNQNWNYMCAECHSTNLVKNYDPANRHFATTWSEIDVSCEACHGPGSRHVAWADKTEGWQALQKDLGLVVTLDERRGVEWRIDPETGNPVRSKPRNSRREIELCARCHARRGVLTADYVPGQAFLDSHRPALLAEGLYHADGQIQDEVYVYGSFLQSKMYHAGVTCSDCHKPHDMALRGAGDQVCLRCHAADRFASPKHHFHPADSVGARCVECHMPARNYMVVDPRRDHSIRVPRPDLSVQLGTPNACTRCHRGQTEGWAADRVREWYGRPARGYQDYAVALHAGRSGAPEGAGLLIGLLGREDQPAIARASAVSLLARYPIPQSLQSISNALHDVDPIVRLGGLDALDALPPNVGSALGVHLLDDPVRAVRIEAGRVLVSVPEAELEPQQRARLSSAVDEYIAAQLVNADRPEAQVNLGNVYTRMGRTREAEAAYRQALTLDTHFVPAYTNLADLYRATGREADAQKTLEQGLAAAPDQAALHHAYGLALVRSKQLDGAVDALARAFALAPDNARYAYVYAVGLEATGEIGRAIEVLEQAQARHEYDAEILSALVGYARKAGRTEEADRYQAQLVELRRRLVSALAAAGVSVPRR